MTATVSTSLAGSWINGAPVVTGGGLHQVINPATGQAVAEYALATSAETAPLNTQYVAMAAAPPDAAKIINNRRAKIWPWFTSGLRVPLPLLEHSSASSCLWS